jgi:ribosomal protein L37AE/L43A
LRPFGRFSGVSWDTQKIRRIREFGWFLQHEADMIEEARQRSTEAVRRRREAILREPLAGLRLCPLCGREVTAPPIEDTGVFQCGACGGFFFDRGGTGEIRLETRGRRGATRREALRVRER